MLLINQWYLESQKPHIIQAKKIKEMFLIKNKSQRSCWVKRDKTQAWWENFNNSKISESGWKGDSRVSTKSFYELLIYKITLIFAEEIELFEKPNASQGSSEEGAKGKLWMFLVSLEYQFRL